MRLEWRPPPKEAGRARLTTTPASRRAAAAAAAVKAVARQQQSIGSRSHTGESKAGDLQRVAHAIASTFGSYCSAGITGRCTARSTHRVQYVNPIPFCLPYKPDKYTPITPYQRLLISHHCLQTLLSSLIFLQIVLLSTFVRWQQMQVLTYNLDNATSCWHDY